MKTTVDLNKTSIQNLNSFIGVYMFMRKSKILYVGKSVNVKARLLSHIENARVDNKERAIIANSEKVQCISTDSEFKALILESKLIQTHHPRYNVRWRDDKSYLYIKILDRDGYPKLSIVRKEAEVRARYFGPFPSRKSASEVLAAIRRIFPFCMQSRIANHACFYSRIGLCDPCPSAIEMVDDLKVRESLQKEYRTNIKRISEILSGNTDPIARDLKMRMDVHTKRQEYELALDYRNRLMQFDRLIHQQLFDHQNIESYDSSEESQKALLKLLQKHFPFLEKLSRIECYDMSNLQFREATASMVVAEGGLMRTDQYRKFRIKNPSARSDFEMFEEVIQRRIRNKWPLPDLIAVDGGRPQVRLVVHVLSRMKISIPVCGIAKRPDRLVLGTINLPSIRPTLHNPGFNLIRLLRDEAHRFAKKYHLQLRDSKKKYNKLI